jgi:hypothetical protein
MVYDRYYNHCKLRVYSRSLVDIANGYEPINTSYAQNRNVTMKSDMETTLN